MPLLPQLILSYNPNSMCQLQTLFGTPVFHKILSGPLKKMLGGQKFASDTEMQSVVNQWLGQQPASFFASSIQKLVDKWDKCLNELGQYVEK